MKLRQTEINAKTQKASNGEINEGMKEGGVRKGFCGCVCE